MTGLSDLDAFSAKRAPDICQRWMDLQHLHRRVERDLWRGMITAGFADDEIIILERMGYLCDLDRDDLRAASRPAPKTHDR